MTEIEFVGTGDAFGSGGRRNTAILVRSRGKTLLMDCGPTTLVGLKSLGIDPREIDAIVVSHFHGDHVAGIPFLLIDYAYDSKRNTPLEIVGPEGVRKHIEGVKDQFYYTTIESSGYELCYREYTTHQPMKLPGFTITPLPAVHQPDTRPHGLRVQTDDRTVFFTGDTGWHDDLPGQVGDADLFISECVFMEPSFEFHMSHHRLVAERARFDAGRTVLTHLGAEVLADLDRVEFDTASDGLKLEI
jgi:ribonuclease BN (tRNA processing enzyme)